MLRFIGKRLLLMIPIVLGISLVVQLFIDITPGDPARIIKGTLVTEEELDEFREEMGFNDPITIRYYRFISGVIQGDFGKSYINGRPVWDELMQRFPYTLLLVCLSTLLSIFIGIPLGVVAATNQFTWKDNASIVVSLLCVSMPFFWFALIMVQVFCVNLNLLPIAGVESWKGWILPTLSLALGFTALIARNMRSSLLEVIRQDYIVTARAKGQSERKVLYRHALKNALIPVIMIVGVVFGLNLGGSLIAEAVFSIPGLGLYTLTGLTSRDYPVIQGSVFFLSILFSIVILIVDILFAIIDPRIRSQFVARRKRVKGV